VVVLAIILSPPQQAMAVQVDRSRGVLDFSPELRILEISIIEFKVVAVAVQGQQRDHYPHPDSLEEMLEIFQEQAETVIYCLGIQHIMVVVVVGAHMLKLP
jgi:hypothetical protein